MTTATRIVELADGIRATLVHQPQATRAAALVKVGAGSWPIYWNICCFAAASAITQTSD